MGDRKICIFNWSGGKDSALALHYALQDRTIEIRYLVTTITEKYNRVSMHGVRDTLLVKQAESIGIPLYQIRLGEIPDMESYDKIMGQHLLKLKAEGITHSIFGDIFLEDLRTYRENKLKEIGLEAIFPLWKRDTSSLISEFLELNYKTILVCVQQNLKPFCGEILTSELIKQLPKDIDPCGENGEFHTFAYEGPIFKKNILFDKGEQVFKSYNSPQQSIENENIDERKSAEVGFWYVDLID